MKSPEKLKGNVQESIIQYTDKHITNKTNNPIMFFKNNKKTTIHLDVSKKS